MLNGECKKMYCGAGSIYWFGQEVENFLDQEIGLSGDASGGLKISIFSSKNANFSLKCPEVTISYSFFGFSDRILQKS